MFLDGASKSKPTPLPSTKRHSVRKRIARLCRAKSPDSNSDELTANEEIDDTSPMRLLSPQVTEGDPSTPQRKARAFLLRNRLSKTSISPRTTHGSIGSPGEVQQQGTEGEVRMSGGNGGGCVAHDLAADAAISKSPFQSPLRRQMQSRKESTVTSVSVPVTPASPTREAALTSHPVVGVEESDSSDGKYETPEEESRGEMRYLDGR